MKETILSWSSKMRWNLADILSKVAVRLRGQKWEPIGFYGIHGNEAAYVKNLIWQTLVLEKFKWDTEDDRETVRMIGEELDKLAQLAGENWGHKE